MGSNDQDPNNANLSATFHHLWMQNCWDRAVPRLRAGNVHDFNIYVDDTDALAAKRLRDALAAAMSTANQNTLEQHLQFQPAPQRQHFHRGRRDSGRKIGLH